MTVARGPGALDVLSRLAEAVATADVPEQAYGAAAVATDGLIGHRLFTVMRFDPDTVEVARVFSSDPAAYPVGGRKPKRDDAWGRQVLFEGRPFLGAGAEVIRAHFADHGTILGLGLDTVLNVPVRLAGRTVGTVNLLRGGTPYGEADIGPARIVAGLLAGPMAACDP